MAVELTDQPSAPAGRLDERDRSAPVPARPGRLRRALPDARLAQRIRGGDEAAFEVLYDRYHRPLLAFCRHMLGTREEAEDALQHVFVQAHRHLAAGTKVAELRPWLYTIARNRCLSVLRARREAVPFDDVPEAVGAGLAVAQEVEQRQDLRDILADLTTLPDEQRAALVLSELGALSHDEIAAVLEVRREKVKALVFQARESLAGRRQARLADCGEIREQLANLRGGALRRAPLRRHLEICEGCRSFRAEVRHQREAMALLLPVVPTVALKAKVVGAVAAGGTALPAAGVTASAGLAAKALAVAAIAGSAGGGYTLVRDQAASERPRPVTEVVAPPALPFSPPPTAATDASAPTPPASELRDTRTAKDTPDATGRRPAQAPADRPVRARGRDGAPGPPAHANTGGNGGGASAVAPRGRPAQPGRASAPGQVKPAPARPAAGTQRATPTRPERPARPVPATKPEATVGVGKAAPVRPERPTPPGLAKKDVEDSI